MTSAQKGSIEKMAKFLEKGASLQYRDKVPLDLSFSSSLLFSTFFFSFFSSFSVRLHGSSRHRQKRPLPSHQVAPRAGSQPLRAGQLRQDAPRLGERARPCSHFLPLAATGGEFLPSPKGQRQTRHATSPPPPSSPREQVLLRGAGRGRDCESVRGGWPARRAFAHSLLGTAHGRIC